MNENFALFPQSASTVSGEVDKLFIFMCVLTAVLSTLVAVLVVTFALRYYHRRDVNRVGGRENIWVELSWLILPFPVLMFIFYWGASVYFQIHRAPQDSLEIDVVAKQWMWKMQHPNGKREIDELHVPVGRPVRLSLISQDVIHSFYIPAFRVKQDVLPQYRTHMWFEATRPGEYELFCAEYCGTRHSQMGGKIIAMTPSDYQAWLAGGVQDQPPEVAGKNLFEKHRCDSCHLGPGEQGRGPSLHDLFAHPVPLNNGQTVVADENYIIESILEPNRKVVAGYQPIMPTYQGQISMDENNQLVAYIKSLAEQDQSGQQPQPETGSQTGSEPTDTPGEASNGASAPQTVDAPDGDGTAEDSPAEAANAEDDSAQPDASEDTIEDKAADQEATEQSPDGAAGTDQNQS